MKLCSSDNHHTAALHASQETHDWKVCQIHVKTFIIKSLLPSHRCYNHCTFFTLVFFTTQSRENVSKNQDHCHVVNGSNMRITITCKARPLIFSGFKSSVLWILWNNVTFFLLLHFDMTLQLLYVKVELFCKHLLF